MRFYAVWCLVAVRPSTCHSDHKADASERGTDSQCEHDFSALLQTAVTTHAIGDVTGVSKLISETKVVHKAFDNGGAAAGADTDVVLKGASENVAAEKMSAANISSDLGGVGGISNATNAVTDQFDAEVGALIEKVTGSVDTLRPLADTFADTVKSSVGSLAPGNQTGELRTKLASALKEVEASFDFISQMVATVRETLMQFLSVAQMSDVESSVGKAFERITGALNDFVVYLVYMERDLKVLLELPDFSNSSGPAAINLCSHTMVWFGDIQQRADSLATETNAGVAQITDLIGNHVTQRAGSVATTKKIDEMVKNIGTALPYVSTSIRSSAQALIAGISDAIAAQRCPAGTSGQTLRGGTCSRLSGSSALLLAACVVHYAFH